MFASGFVIFYMHHFCTSMLNVHTLSLALSLFLIHFNNLQERTQDKERQCKYYRAAHTYSTHLVDLMSSMFPTMLRTCTIFHSKGTWGVCRPCAVSYSNRWALTCGTFDCTLQSLPPLTVKIDPVLRHLCGDFWHDIPFLVCAHCVWVRVGSGRLAGVIG